jgi:hypothetical protein
MCPGMHADLLKPRPGFLTTHYDLSEQFNRLPGPERAKLKTVLDYSSATDHESQWTTHKHMFPVPYLQSYLAFKGLNNLLRLQDAAERSGSLPLRSRNSCPRISGRKGPDGPSIAPAPHSPGVAFKEFDVYCLKRESMQHLFVGVAALVLLFLSSLAR